MSDTDDSHTSDELDSSNSENSPNSPTVKIKEEDFSSKTRFTDLELIVEGHSLHVSKHLLALSSSVFEAMFQGEFVEKYNDKLPLPQKKYEDVLEFLRCIYPNILKSVTLANVNAVLPLADEYQVKKLKEDCESCLKTRLTDKITTEDLFELLIKAETFHLKQLTERCKETATKRSHAEIEKADKKIKLPKDIKDEIRVRIIQKLEKIYKYSSEQLVTSKALCKFLGAADKKKDIVNQYMNGEVNGDWGSLAVSSTMKKSIKLIIYDITFSINASINENYPYGLQVLIESSCQNEYDVHCLCAVVVNNWMKNKDNIIDIQKYQFTNATQKREWYVSNSSSGVMNEEKGFICKGIINIDVFLFSIQKAT